MTSPSWVGWRCRPGTRALWALGVLSAPLVLAPLWWGVVAVIGGLDLLLLLGVVLDYLAVRRHLHLEVVRRVEPRLSVGAEHTVELHMDHRGGEPVQVWIRDAHPDACKREPCESIADVWTLAGRGRWLASGETLTVSYTVVPLRRGKMTFGPMDLGLQSRFGLATVTVQRPTVLHVDVGPSVEMIARLGQARAQARPRLSWWGGRRVPWRRGSGESAQLRDYVQGDSVRAIDWKATARRQRPVVRTREAERGQHVILCIDVGRSMAAQAGQLTRLDLALNAAVGVGWAALKAEDRVGFAAVADGVRTWLAPRRGMEHHRRLMEAMRDLEPQPCTTAFEEVGAWVLTHARRRSLVVVFTDLYEDEVAQSVVRGLSHLRTRHAVMCVTATDGGLDAQRRRVPQHEAQVFDQAVAIELWRARCARIQMLSQSGVCVVEGSPDTLALSALEAYADLKSRRGVL